MVFLSTKLTGAKEISQSLDQFQQKQKSTYTPQTLDEAADLGVRIAKEKVHVVSGKLKNGIGKQRINQNTIEVHAITEYAGIENDRAGSKGAQGTHNYMTQSRNEVAKQFPKMIITNIEKNLRENKPRTV